MFESVGIYARVSVEHDRDDSIQSQLMLAREWIRRRQAEGQELCEYRCYVDRGVSGTTFDRKGFQEMLRDAVCGRISCIVCKDASRLGRDYLRTGEYIEKILPSMGIRLVLVSEGYDSREKIPGSLEANMRNLMNEWYAKDIGRRVRAVKQVKRQQGHYLGSTAPYGMRVVRRDGIRRLEPDRETAQIVEQMREWRRQGTGITEIQRRLWERGIQPPEEYRKKGQVYGERRKAPRWSRGTIYRILGQIDSCPENGNNT